MTWVIGKVKTGCGAGHYWNGNPDLHKEPSAYLNDVKLAALRQREERGHITERSGRRANGEDLVQLWTDANRLMMVIQT